MRKRFDGWRPKTGNDANQVFSTRDFNRGKIEHVRFQRFQPFFVPFKDLKTVKTVEYLIPLPFPAIEITG